VVNLEGSVGGSGCHSIQLPGFGEPIQADSGLFIGKQPDWQAYLKGLQPVLDVIVATGMLSDGDLQRLRSFWKQKLPGIQLDQGTLVHGDFAMTAIFVDGETYIGLIDFGDALIGDPLMDLAYFRFKEITKPYGTATYQLLLAAYTKATGFTWDNASDETILLYMIFWALCRLRHCPDVALRNKFYDKLHKVADLI
jgi:Ser/Thr protein kinase RdoA (MazF antagonist)